MPNYNFKCGKCGMTLELFAKMTDPTPTAYCCAEVMNRDYSVDKSGFIPTKGMYSHDSRTR